MIALITGLQDTLAYLRPEAATSAPQESFAQVLKSVSAPETSPEPAPPAQYQVQAGDNLWEIAKKLGYADPMELARVNGIKNPNLIQPGQVLKLPPAESAGKTVTPTPVKSGRGQRGRQVKVEYAAHSPPASKAGTMVTASWYGAQHAGKRMANGSPFNMHDDTVAHRSLPLGTKLRLTNPENGRSVVVEVTDRGPFVAGRTLDISYGVARKLGMVNSGVARLRMDKV
jgi:rare lipoprotein A